MQEIWKDVPWAADAYEVSNFGNVRTKKRTIVTKSGVKKLLKSHPVAQYIRKDGRVTVSIKCPWKTSPTRVSSLVADVFIGPRPNGFDICHNDGNALNNHVENLRYDTRTGNARDKIKHGTILRGSLNKTAKLSESQASEIRLMLKNGMYQKDIAKLFGVHQSLISKIKNGVVWSWLP